MMIYTILKSLIWVGQPYQSLLTMKSHKPICSNGNSPLVMDALKMAYGRRNYPKLHHSDKGSQYTSHDYLELLSEKEVLISMSSTGNCHDNAILESFWGTLKTECASERYPSRQLVRQAMFEYIEVWYNRERPHSALGYLSPEAFEQRHL